MYAVIDMGSNTMRLGIYHNENGNFKQFFHKKEMVGLAGYVKDGFLTEEGIEAAASVLKEFGTIVRNLGIEHVMVFATASLQSGIDIAADGIPGLAAEFAVHQVIKIVLLSRPPEDKSISRLKERTGARLGIGKIPLL